MKEKRRVESVCRKCGENPINNKTAYSRFGEIADVCKECEERQFELMESSCLSSHIAMFGMCLATNTPFYPLLLPPVEEFSKMPKKWGLYNGMLDEKGLRVKNDRYMGFADGATNILKVFGRELTEKDTAKFVQYEISRLEKLGGTIEQREEWGEQDLWANLPVSTKVYNDLDRRLERKLDNYHGAYLSSNTIDYLHKICKLEYAEDYLQSIGDIASLQKVRGVIDNIMSSEQLRKKDEKPVEGMRLDALVTALENAGAMRDGMFLSHDDLIVAMRDKHVKSKKYDYSLDVCDQMKLDIVNNARSNADMEMLSELPEAMRAVDEYGEFESEETEEERKKKAFAGLTKVQFTSEDQ